MRLKFQSVDLKHKKEQGYCCHSVRKAAVCMACTSLPWEEMFSQILFSTVPKACWHAAFQDHCQRQVVVLRITAHIRQVCCHNNINHRTIMHNNPSNLIFYLLHWQAATSLKKNIDLLPWNGLRALVYFIFFQIWAYCYFTILHSPDTF